MLNAPIPPHVDPRKLVDRGITLEGVVPVKSLPRLCEQLTDDLGEVQVRLTFERDEQRIPVIRGSLNVEVRMICQRCLEPAALPVHGEYIYAVVREGDSDRSLPKGYDALEVGEEPLDVLTMVEDELLLSLPIVPLHDAKVCQQPAGQDEPEPNENEVSRSNPFSVLAQLKRDPNV